MSFEDVMMKRLAECGAEACQEVERGLQAGRPLGDAVLDAIESLPTSKTRELRRWVEDWEAYDEWLKFEGEGWSARKNGGWIFIDAPRSYSVKMRREKYRWNSLEPVPGSPSLVTVAAAGGVKRVKFYNDNASDVYYAKTSTLPEYQARFRIVGA